MNTSFINAGQMAAFVHNDHNRLIAQMLTEVKAPLPTARAFKYSFHAGPSLNECKDAYIEAVDYMRELCRTTRLAPKNITSRILEEADASPRLTITFIVEGELPYEDPEAA